MNSWKIIPAAVVIFGAGVITGGLLVNYVEQPRLQAIHSPSVKEDEGNSRLPANNRDHDQPRPPEMLGRQFVQQLDGALHFTPEQRAAITKIVADGQERNRELWTNVAPQMHKVLQDVRQQIREQLTPDQRKQFEALLKRFRPAGHHPPPDSPPPTNEPPVSAPPRPPPGV